MTSLVNCPHCSTRVLPMPGRICPACRRNVDTPPDSQSTGKPVNRPLGSYSTGAPQPVFASPTVIALSAAKTWKVVGALILAFLIVVLWFFVGLMYRRIFVTAIVLAVVIPVYLLFLVPLTLVRLAAGQKLVISSDRLQIVQGTRIVAQVPYRNIARISTFNYGRNSLLGIDLAYPHDKETFWTWGQRRDSVLYGFDFILADSYAEPPAAIRNRIMAYLQPSQTGMPGKSQGKADTR